MQKALRFLSREVPLRPAARWGLSLLTSASGLATKTKVPPAVTFTPILPSSSDPLLSALAPLSHNPYYSAVMRVAEYVLPPTETSLSRVKISGRSCEKAPKEPMEMPDAPLSDRTFTQNTFNTVIKHHFPELTTAHEGLCTGHIAMWYRYYLSSKDYLAELSCIVKSLETAKKLDATQLQLLQDISKIQKSDSTFALSSKDSLLFGIPIHFSRKKSIDFAMEHSLENPGKLVVLFPYNSRIGHTIGMVAKKDGIITYFDPNYGEQTFRDSDIARDRLSKLLLTQYASSKPHLGFFKGSLYTKPVAETLECPDHPKPMT